MKQLILVVFALLMLEPVAANAQTPVAIEGLQVIAERQYASDTAESIDIKSDGVFLVSARVYQFDSSENANSTWEKLVAAESIQADLPEDDDSFTYETSELDDVGDRATVLSLTAKTSDDETGAFRTVIIQTDATIVTVTAIAGSKESAEVADDIAISMSNREAGDNETTYEGMGGSTGGVWEMFLPADADELAGLKAYADKETRPA